MYVYVLAAAARFPKGRKMGGSEFVFYENTRTSDIVKCVWLRGRIYGNIMDSNNNNKKKHLRLYHRSLSLVIIIFIWLNVTT